MSTPGDDLDDTIIRLVEPGPEPPATRGTLPVASPSTPEPRGVWSLRVRGTSTVVPLDRPVEVGRRAGSSRIDEQPSPRRVVVRDHQGEVSARHVRIEQLGENLVVHDLRSTNGVVIHWATGASRRLRPGESIAVLPDAVIVLSTDVELDFVAAPSPSPLPAPLGA